jgi:hypothetical protein
MIIRSSTPCGLAERTNRPKAMLYNRMEEAGALHFFVQVSESVRFSDGDRGRVLPGGLSGKGPEGWRPRLRRMQTIPGTPPVLPSPTTRRHSTLRIIDVRDNFR